MTVKWHFSIINAAVQCHILRTFEEKRNYKNEENPRNELQFVMKCTINIVTENKLLQIFTCW
jgi:hypothetical protein